MHPCFQPNLTSPNAAPIVSTKKGTEVEEVSRLIEKGEGSKALQTNNSFYALDISALEKSPREQGMQTQEVINFQV